jgi:hypothetical protein
MAHRLRASDPPYAPRCTSIRMLDNAALKPDYRSGVRVAVGVAIQWWYTVVVGGVDVHPEFPALMTLRPAVIPIIL